VVDVCVPKSNICDSFSDKLDILNQNENDMFELKINSFGIVAYVPLVKEIEPLPFIKFDVSLIPLLLINV